MTTALNGFRPHKDASLYTELKGFDFEKFKASTNMGVAAPSDLRGFASPRHDQKSSSSCVAQSIVKALELKRIMKYGHGAHVDLSRLAVYFLARELMVPSEINFDKGTHIVLAAEILRTFGVCKEEDWPFDVNIVNRRPSWDVLQTSYDHKIDAWYEIKSTGADRVKDVALALAVGYPVVYGTAVGDDWMNYNGSTPLGNVSNILGYHATVLEGYDPQRKVFFGENSWGNWWGLDGFYEIEEDVIAGSHSSEFVVIQAGFED